MNKEAIKMPEDTILIPREKMLEGKEFYAAGLDEALSKCLEEECEAVFMPQLIDARIQAPKEARIWHSWYSTLSIRAKGKGESTNVSTKGGTEFVVYAHIPNYFSNPKNIKIAKERGFVKGVGKMPRKEFNRLLDLEDDKNVFIIDYNTLKSSKSGLIPLKNALKHPQTIPFMGGKERAEAYLERHKEVFGNKIRIEYFDALSGKPSGCLLFIGDDFNYGGIGDHDLSLKGHFIGTCTEDVMQKIL